MGKIFYNFSLLYYFFYKYFFVNFIIYFINILKIVLNFSIEKRIFVSRNKCIFPFFFLSRYILEYATKCNGIIISNDQFKDLYQEKPEWRETIENQILPPTFVGDHLMFPDDPLGRNGPKLDTFLRHSI